MTKGLMTYKPEDPLKKTELMAVGMRMSRKKELIASKREVFSCKTPDERSVSPMFGGVEGPSRIPGQVAEEEKVGMDIPLEAETHETDVPETDIRETDVRELYFREHHETRVGETKVGETRVGNSISVDANIQIQTALINK